MGLEVHSLLCEKWQKFKDTIIPDIPGGEQIEEYAERLFEKMRFILNARHLLPPLILPDEEQNPEFEIRLRYLCFSLIFHFYRIFHQKARVYERIPKEAESRCLLHCWCS